MVVSSQSKVKASKSLVLPQQATAKSHQSLMLSGCLQRTKTWKQSLYGTIETNEADQTYYFLCELIHYVLPYKLVFFISLQHYVASPFTKKAQLTHQPYCKYWSICMHKLWEFMSMGIYLALTEKRKDGSHWYGIVVKSSFFLYLAWLLVLAKKKYEPKSIQFNLQSSLLFSLPLSFTSTQYTKYILVLLYSVQNVEVVCALFVPGTNPYTRSIY